MNPDEGEAQEQKRVLPRSEADFNMLMTDTVWGSSQVSKELKDKVAYYYAIKDKDGKDSIKKESLWETLRYYTRDIRLSNLDNRETIYVRYYLRLAGDFLQVNQIEPFIISLSCAVDVLETAQSKKGFLRKRMNTITSEQYGEFEQKKKTLFGKGQGGER
jgi:hypothetical protein